MSNLYGINLKPTKYLALSVSLLTIGACSHKGEPYADLYANAPTDETYFQYNHPNVNEAELLAAVDDFNDGYEDANLPVEENVRETVVRVERYEENSKPARSSTVRQYSSRRAAYRLSSFPRIASRPATRGEYVLNGYLFVRGERSWEEVSRLIYGREDRAHLLAQWNGGQQLQPGSVVYYSSPFRPDDKSALKRFEEDFGLNLESLVVREGDTLSLIAARMYGSPELWEELASLNQHQIPNPDIIEIGQTLLIAPSIRNTQPVLDQAIAQLRAQAEEELMAQVEVAPATPVQEDPYMSEDFAQFEDSQGPPEEQLAQDIQNVQDSYQNNDQASFESQEPVAQTAESDYETVPVEDIAYLLGALLCVAALVVLIVRRRKAGANQADDYANVVNKRNGTEG